MQYGIETIMPLTAQKHYTVGYHDTQQHKYEIWEYAVDSYEAIAHSKEDVPYLQEHPHLLITAQAKRLIKSLVLWLQVFQWDINYETRNHVVDEQTHHHGSIFSVIR